MDLARHQQHLQQLITAGPDSVQADDPYIRNVAQSGHLEVLREVIWWWRQFDIERSCVLTSSVLKRRNRFEDTVRDFAAGRHLSPFVEGLAQSFLEYVSHGADLLTACVARLEWAVLQVKQGDTREHSIEWPCDPRPILEGGQPLEDINGDATYRTVVSRQIPGFVELFRIE
jgi:hypothetical protein